MDLNVGDWEGKLSSVATPAAFLYQISAKDRADPHWAAESTGAKLQDIANIVLGRTVGFTPFPSVSNYPQTFNIGNALNPTTYLGLALWVAGEIGILSKRWGSIGKKIAYGGILGGIFDDAAVPQPGTPHSTAGQVYYPVGQAMSGGGVAHSHVQVGQR